MGRFGNKVSQETKKRSSTIQVNKFEIAENALKIIAKICTPQNDNFAGDYFKEFYDAVLTAQRFKDKDLTFFQFLEDDNDFKFRHYLVDLFNDIKTELSAHENTNDTQVVVAGAFSSGKSSFLNTIIGYDNLLPNGVDPVSVVNTFIYCSQRANDISVKGVNLKNALVQLDKDILQCIQHSSKSNVYLASVLDKLFVEVPANVWTKGLAFIDTPGYNKSDSANESNGKTDQDTATEAFSKGNVLFWVVDIEDGNVVTTGEEMINTFLDKHDNNAKVVVIFNKADKKPQNEIESIVRTAANKFKLNNNHNFIDVVAFSSVDKRMCYSFRGNTIESLFEQVRASGTGYSSVENIIRDVEEMFDDRIEWHENKLNDWKEALADAKKEKNEDYESLNDIKEGNKNQIGWFKKIMIDTYDQIMDASSKYYELADTFHEDVLREVGGVFRYGSAQWGDGDVYDAYVRDACKVIDGFMEKLNNVNYRYYEKDNRQDAINSIEERYQWILDRFKIFYDNDCTHVDECQNGVNTEDAYIRAWRDYKYKIVTGLRTGIERFNKSRNNYINDAKLEQKYNVNVFDAIASNNYSDFENCFANGVSLMDYNAEGYSALTYAVMYGANDMVQFMIDHNADLSAYDKRGYNAFHTAVENNYKDMCKMLLDADPTLATKKSANGESIMEIANKNKFINWLEKKI